MDPITRFLYENTLSVNKTLEHKLYSKVKPIYDKTDISHGWEYHILPVIHWSIKIADEICFRRKKRLNYNIVFASAALHDITRPLDSKNHEVTGGQAVRKMSKFLSEWFNDDEIETIASAVEEHRASTGNPKDIYGEIISDADRASDLDVDVLIIRCWYYRLTNMPELDTEDKMFEDIFTFLQTKYGKDGYAKLITPEANEIAKHRWKTVKKTVLDREKMRKSFDRLVKNGVLKWTQ